MGTIILTGGGTAGHITPNIALLPYLKQHFSKIVYIGSYTGMEKNMITALGDIEYYAIETAKLNRNKFLSNFSIPIKFLKGKKQALEIIKKIKPDIIFSKGGYVSLPVVFAAKNLNIPVVAHESDLTLGLANRISKNKCSCICTTFKETANKLGKKSIYTGSPIRQTTTSNIKINHNNKPILLITGGSLGSKVINEVVWQSINELTKKYYVIHQVGKNNFNSDIKNANYKQIEFADNMQQLISNASVVVSRAGSNTIFELAYAQKPMLLIPLPKGASRGDQVDNANHFDKLGYAKVLYQSDLTPTTFVNCVNSLYNNSKKYINTLKNANIPNGTEKIIKVLLNYKKSYM